MEPEQWQARAYKGYKWIVQDPDLLGGKLAIRETRLSVAHVLECLANDWSLAEMEDAFGPIPREALTEVLMVAAELAGDPHVAA